MSTNQHLEGTRPGNSTDLAERAALLELSFDAIIVRNWRDEVTYWNRGAEEMYGWRREEAKGKVTHQLLQTEFPEPLHQIREKYRQTGRWAGELVHRRRDGRRLIVATRWALQTDGQGNPVAILETNSDVTERRDMEEALRKALEHEVAERTATVAKQSVELAQTETALHRQAEVLKSILNSMGDGVVVADPSGKILRCNPAAERLLEIDENDATFQDWLRRHETCLPEVVTNQRPREHPLARALLGEPVDGAEILIRHDQASEEVWALAKTRPLIDLNTSGGTVMVFSDVTERKRLEKQVAEISDREQRRIGQDLHDSVCQHLVSTAYACNMLAQTLAAQGCSEADRAREIVHSINEAIRQARGLARALYPIDLTADGLIVALEELTEMVQKSTGICCSFRSEGAATIGDSAIGINLYRIAQEGINNAVKHSQASQISVLLATDDHQIKLVIEDDGSGFRPEFLKRKGLGLHIMNYRARMIGAALEIESCPGGRGTRVTCSRRGSYGSGEVSPELQSLKS